MKNYGSRSIPLADIDITGGFWQQKQELNRNVTIHSVYNRFSDTGRFDAFRVDWKEGEPNRPHIFWDSDVAKWLESAAYIIEKHPSPDLETIVDGVVDLIEKNQWEDGYFNICYTLFEPEDRFTERYNHELYCAGHLMEAAVAYFNATGKDKFLKIMCKYADMIEKAFVTEKWAEFNSPGHEEIELALIKLYEATNEKRYLNLSKYFIDVRGSDEEDPYSQAHKPVREQDEVIGHCVRAMYLYCGMADVAAKTGDDELFAAAKRLFTDVVTKKMYITGGIGQTCVGEAFLDGYDLPDTSSYCETCASIGLVLLAQRMSRIEPNAFYDDAAELALYNGFLGGMSLDGKSFFYDNANEIDLTGKNNPTENRHRPFYPLTRRVEVFSCSCCPPNVTRMIAEVGELAYSTDGETLFCHHYMDSTARFDGKSITMKTDYPNSGEVKITCSGDFTLALRVPGWCRSFTVNKPYDKKDNGFIYIDVTDGEEIDFSMDMPVRFVQSNPLVRQHANRVAVTRGPLVYCAEGVDNPLPLRGLYVDTASRGRLEFDGTLGVNAITLDGFVRPQSDELYYDYDGRLLPQSIRLIPYYAYANRDESDMLIWLGIK